MTHQLIKLFRVLSHLRVDRHLKRTPSQRQFAFDDEGRVVQVLHATLQVANQKPEVETGHVRLDDLLEVLFLAALCVLSRNVQVLERVDALQEPDLLADFEVGAHLLNCVDLAEQLEVDEVLDPLEAFARDPEQNVVDRDLLALHRHDRLDALDDDSADFAFRNFEIVSVVK